MNYSLDGIKSQKYQNQLRRFSGDKKLFCASLVSYLQVYLFYVIVVKQQKIAGNSECKSGVNPAQYRLL